MSQYTSETGGAPVSSARRGPVAVVTLQRPAARNAVDPATALALYEAMLEFDADDDASVAVLTGAGDCFCAGFD
ncbi:MAG: enoyl-CoA hydratase-related protein, partial [Gammaproteobacteria bacterium]